MENKRQHPRKRGSATDLASIGRDAVNNIDVVCHRCVALDARKPMTIWDGGGLGANYDGVNGWYYQIGVIKYIFLDYERYSNSLSSGC